MKGSQKGTKLNEIRYFRQPRPYTRKRITKTRLLPDFPGLHENSNSSPKEQNRRSTSARSSEKSRNRCVTLDRDQRSREIAWISYTSDSEDSDDFNVIQGHYQNRGRDTFVKTVPEREIIVTFPKVQETQIIGKLPKYEDRELIVNLSKRQERQFIVNVPKSSHLPKNNGRGKIETEVQKETQIEQERSEEKVKNVEEKSVEKKETKTSGKRKIQEERKKEIGGKDRHVKTESQASEKSSYDSEKSFWLRYERIRKILDFFSHLLGRRGTMQREKEVATNARIRERVVTKADTSQNAETKKTIDSSIKNRPRRSNHKSTNRKKDLAKQQVEDRVFSGLTKQFMDTRDEKLRATLLEHEMRSRKLEEENRRYKRILEDKLNTRQMSSPLH